MPTLTTATSHRTRATLLEVARSHATSRALSLTTRDVFARLADGDTRETFDDLDLQDAFFEAAVSLSTRYGQSYARRCHGSDLHALRAAVLNGEDIAGVTVTLSVTLQAPDRHAVNDIIDALRRAEIGDSTITKVTEA